jgi:hypothetical protein
MIFNHWISKTRAANSFFFYFLLVYHFTVSSYLIAHEQPQRLSNYFRRKSVNDTLLAAKRLALSESGFVFDPVSGQSFTVNETGLVILRLAQHEDDFEQLVEQLAEQFDASVVEINRDVQDFANRLKSFLR